MSQKSPSLNSLQFISHLSNGLLLVYNFVAIRLFASFLDVELFEIGNDLFFEFSEVHIPTFFIVTVIA